MIALIDYGMGNLRSVQKAFEKVGASISVVSKPDEVLKAGAVVLPGVGAFEDGIKNLEANGLAKAIVEAINLGRPFLGICLGLQLLFDESYENGLHEGLGVIKGTVRKLPGKVKVPHIGWNQIKSEKPCYLLKDVGDGANVYFDHSYYAQPEDKKDILTITNYGLDFASSIHKQNVYAVQFHPEKSSEAGLKIIENFVYVVENL